MREEAKSWWNKLPPREITKIQFSVRVHCCDAFSLFMTHSVPSIVCFVFLWLLFSFSVATALQLLALLLQARRIACKIFRPPSSKAASLGVTALLLSLSTVCFVLCFEHSMESLAVLLCCVSVGLLWALLHVDMFAHPSLLFSIARACTYLIFVACPLLVPPPLYITLTYELLGFHNERYDLTRGMRVLIFWPAWLRADVVEWIRLVGHEVPLVRWLYVNSLSAVEVQKCNRFVASLPRAHSVKSRFMCTLLCLKPTKLCFRSTCGNCCGGTTWDGRLFCIRRIPSPTRFPLTHSCPCFALVSIS
jgi:hypothetical protein